MSPELVVRALGRAVVGAFFVHSGQRVLRTPGPAAALSAPTLAAVRTRLPALPGDDVAVVRLNAAVHVVAGALLASGRFPRAAALTLAASLVPTTAAGHPYWSIDDPAARRQQKAQFDKNLAILGGLLMAAGA